VKDTTRALECKSNGNSSFGKKEFQQSLHHYSGRCSTHKKHSHSAVMLLSELEPRTAGHDGTVLSSLGDLISVSTTQLLDLSTACIFEADLLPVRCPLCST
jgi:hypothetical protein